MVMSILGSSVEQEFTVDGTYELGRGIGMVRQINVTDFGTESLELVEYFIP
jgi:hypothetical protein